MVHDIDLMSEYPPGFTCKNSFIYLIILISYDSISEFFSFPKHIYVLKTIVYLKFNMSFYFIHIINYN